MEALVQKVETLLKNDQLTSYIKRELKSLNTSRSFIYPMMFKNQTELSVISAPYVETIGDNAFESCIRLQQSSVDFTNVREIGEEAFKYAFSNYYYGTSNEFPMCETIGASAFYGARLYSLSFPNCVSIGKSAFASCTAENIYAPKCEYIGSGAFVSCNISGTASFSKCVAVGDYAFSGATNLTGIDLRALTHLSTNTLSGCYQLTSLNIENVSSIQSGAFSDLNRLSELYLPNISTFSNITFNSALKSLIANESKSYIDVYKFANQSYLNYISVSGSIDSIGYAAFQNCYELKSVNGIFNASVVNNNAFENCYKLEEFRFANVESIYAGAFKNCSSLSMINAPNCKMLGHTNYSATGNAVFENCTNLSYVNLPSVPFIVAGMFKNCYGLKYAFLDSCSRIQPNAFENCSSLLQVSANECIEIGQSAFKGCRSFRNIDFENVNTIGGSAFYGVDAYELNLPKLRMTTGTLIENCSNLTSVFIGGSNFTPYNQDGEAVIKNCPNVMNFKISSYYTNILYYGTTDDLFDESTNIQNLEIGNITSVFERAFCPENGSYRLNNVESIALPDCEVIGSSAFYGSKLKNFSFPKCHTINAHAFAYNQNLKSITIPNVSKIGSSAFYTAYAEFPYDQMKDYYTYVLPQEFVVEFIGNPFGVHGYKDDESGNRTWNTYYDHINILVPNDMIDDYRNAYSGTPYASRFIQLATN